LTHERPPGIAAPRRIAGIPESREFEMILEVENLSKTFGKFTAVQDVSFSIPKSEIVGLVGPNGAGKTTTLHMILGLISPSSGSVRIFDKPFEKNREEILQQMNFIAPYVTYPARLTVYENLIVFARLYNTRDASAKIGEMLRLFAIEHLKNTPVSRLSSGETTRVGLCKAFLNEPRLLLLDEPTAYLDPQAAQQVKQILLDRRKEHGTTILFTSHNMSEVEELCDCVYFLSRGRVLANGSPIAVTQAILQEHRDEPALVEAFLHVANRNNS
jgi:ABC-2 type transport system ATP-binding protein